MKIIGKNKLRLLSEDAVMKPGTAAQVGGGIISENRGFTLIELIIVCAVIVVLAALAIPSYTNLVNVAKISRAREEIRSIEKAIDAFQADRGRLPAPNEIPEVNMLDPWKRAYCYRPVTSTTGTRYMDFTGVNPLNDDYDLYSLGEDGTSTQSTSDPASQKNIVRAANGAYDGLASDY